MMKEPEQKKVADERETLVPCQPGIMDLLRAATCWLGLGLGPGMGMGWEVVFALLINLPLLGS